jgi:hypothetical protein
LKRKQSVDLNLAEAEHVESKLIEIWKSLSDPYQDIGMRAFIRALGWAYDRMPDVRRHLDSPNSALRERLTRRLGHPVVDIFCTAKCLSLHKTTLSNRVSEAEMESDFLRGAGQK